MFVYTAPIDYSAGAKFGALIMMAKTSFSAVAVSAFVLLGSASVQAATVHVETFEDNVTTLASWVADAAGTTRIFLDGEGSLVTPNGRAYGFVTNTAIATGVDEFQNMMRTRSPRASGVNTLAGDAASGVAADGMGANKWGSGNSAPALVGLTADRFASAGDFGFTVDAPAPTRSAAAAQTLSSGSTLAPSPAPSLSQLAASSPSTTLASVLSSIPSLQTTGDAGTATTQLVTTTPLPAAIPLPAAALLLMGALSAMGLVGRRKS